MSGPEPRVSAIRGLDQLWRLTVEPTLAACAWLALLTGWHLFGFALIEIGRAVRVRRIEATR